MIESIFRRSIAIIGNSDVYSYPRNSRGKASRAAFSQCMCPVAALGSRTLEFPIHLSMAIKFSLENPTVSYKV